jgi:hypothetical protein
MEKQLDRNIKLEKGFISKKMKKIYSILSIILILGLVTRIFNSELFITSYNWKYNSGLNIGDYIDFEFYKIKDKVIYLKDKPLAKIKYCYWKGIIIEDLASGNQGRYENK